MKIILAICGNGYCGCDSEEAFHFDEDTKDDWIESEIWEWACENAESFAHVHFGWDEPYTDEDYDDYLENYVTYDWHEATYDEYLEWCDNWNVEPEFEEE
jgi:hypothetical protein